MEWSVSRKDEIKLSWVTTTNYQYNLECYRSRLHKPKIESISVSYVHCTGSASAIATAMLWYKPHKPPPILSVFNWWISQATPSGFTVRTVLCITCEHLKGVVYLLLIIYLQWEVLCSWQLFIPTTTANSDGAKWVLIIVVLMWLTAELCQHKNYVMHWIV